MFHRVVNALRGSHDEETSGQKNTDDAAVSPHVDSLSHFTEAAETITQLRNQKRYEEAEAVLEWCLEQAAEDEQITKPPAGYYKQLAMLYRKQDRYEDEVQLIERYLAAATNPREDLVQRLQRAESLIACTR
jgi:tetratricopeptide (TPR) repeat protein